jgi:hypothetical protein
VSFGHLFQFPIPALPVIALLFQVPLTTLAVVVEWNQRKKRRATSLSIPPPQMRQPTTVPAEGPVEQAAPPSRPPEPPRQPPLSLPQQPQISIEPRTSSAPVAAASEAEAAATPEIPPIVEAQAPGVVEGQPGVEMPPAPSQPIEKVAVEPQRKQPIPIRLGLRKTRENFLARIRAAITGSARVDEIYEGLEEALIGAELFGKRSSRK